MCRRLPVGWMVLAIAAGLPDWGRSQEGGYSGRVVHGMFGPRIIGQPIQSLADRRVERGIIRDDYGNFLGRGRPTNGRMFSLTPRPSYNRPPATPPPAPEPARELIPQEVEGPAEQPGPSVPEAPSGPDRWLRTEGAVEETKPPASPAATPPAGPSSSAPSPTTGGAARPIRGSPVVLATPDHRSAQAPGGHLVRILQRIPPIRQGGPIQVIMDNDTAILRGRVATVADRELAENLARLEPGVWQVRNELIVGSSAGSSVAKSRD